jgi:acetyl esterase/lipase
MADIRHEMFMDRDTRLYPIVVNPAIRQIAADDIKTFMRTQITDPSLSDTLIPAYELGCKRILISDDFLPALNRDNVTVETSRINHLTPQGIATVNGHTEPYDAIIYATGFDLEGHRYGFNVTGADGITLAQRWQDQSDAYKSAMVPGMPNYFMVTGPNAGVGTTSVVYLIEQSVDWIIDVIKTAGRNTLISVTQTACDAFSNDLHARLGNTVWASGCDSWYISANGRIEALFPSNAQDFAEQMRNVDLNDFLVQDIPGRDNLPPPNWTPKRETASKADTDHRILDPTIKAILTSPNAQNSPRMPEMSATDARAFYADMVKKLETPISIPCHVANHTLPLAGRTLDIRLYQPKNMRPDAPVLVYFHGGGWVIGDLDTHDNPCRAMAIGSGGCVVSIDYRRAPEHPFPAAIQDGYDAFLWIAEHGAKLGLNTQNLGIGGDSAGGNIAAAVSLMLRDSNLANCAWQVLIYPSVISQLETESSLAFAKGYGLDADVMDWFAGHYIPPDTDLSDPRLSPLLATSHANLPPALVVTAGFDPLRDSGLQYAEQLRESGVHVQYKEYPDLIHGFASWAGIIPSASAALNEIAELIGDLAQQKPPSQ